MRTMSDQLRSFVNAIDPSFQNATAIGQDRIVRKEVSVGAIREIEPPQNHIGLSIAPFKDVAADDIVFNYLTVQTDGLAPARAEDAESELAQKDDYAKGQGRASLIDWSLKDHYDASDVNRAREFSRIIEAMANGDLPLTVTSTMEDWAAKIARDRLRRRRKLDNRIELLIMSALSSGQIVYDDGKIKFAVDYGRPVNQAASNVANDLAGAGVVDGVADWSGTAFDPIKFFNSVNDFMFNTYGVHMKGVLGSKKAFNAIVNSDKFSQRAGLGAAYNGANAPVAPSLLYLMDGWGPQAARDVVTNATGMEFREYDAVYRTRALNSTSIVNTRFMPQNRLVFLPDLADLDAVDDTDIGFGKTLTSPHPEGNWTPGFYEWERSTVDPWGHDMGNGIKAFPVFPFMEYTYSVDLVLPA